MKYRTGVYGLRIGDLEPWKNYTKLNYDKINHTFGLKFYIYEKRNPLTVLPLSSTRNTVSTSKHCLNLLQNVFHIYFTFKYFQTIHS